MTNNYPITGHCLVRNEDQFIRYAINSALPFLDRLIIYDTGSTDKTVDIIRSIKSPKIFFAQKGPQSPAEITNLRNDMISQTKTDWFFLLDGDEVWSQKTLKDYLEFTLDQPKAILATFLHTRNCVGDIYHYRDESSGRYEIAGLKGHLNIRAYRRALKWSGTYPLEKCVDTTDKNSLAFFDGYYWHMTHLSRSSGTDPVLGFRRRAFDLGILARENELPEVFSGQNFPRRSLFYFGISLVKRLIW